MPGDPHLLTDVRIDLRQAALRPVYAVATDTRRIPNRVGVLRDIGVVGGRDNLGQAVLLRLLTPLGELAALGHPDYGSRLHTLIGDRNTDTRRALVRLYILESLAREPRIAEVVEVAVAPHPAQRGGVDVLVRVRPTGSQDVVRIGPFTLELET
jgi:phage baseplate assembly protein W